MFEHGDVESLTYYECNEYCIDSSIFSFENDGDDEYYFFVHDKPGMCFGMPFGTMLVSIPIEGLTLIEIGVSPVLII